MKRKEKVRTWPGCKNIQTNKFIKLSKWWLSKMSLTLLSNAFYIKMIFRMLNWIFAKQAAIDFFHWATKVEYHYIKEILFIPWLSISFLTELLTLEFKLPWRQEVESDWKWLRLKESKLITRDRAEGEDKELYSFNLCLYRKTDNFVIGQSGFKLILTNNL